MRAPAGYAIVKEVGAGSVFEVALVRGQAEVVVCKRVRASLLGEPVALAAMQREIGALERLGGRHAPALVGHGHDAAGPFCLQGRSEDASLLHGLSCYGDPFPPEVIRDMVPLFFRALAGVHAAGVVHGDVNPDHLFPPPTEFIDFGLARWPGIDPALVGPGERGTLPYVAPEVLRGEVAPDAANDVYALAATMAHLAAGREPCRAATAAARLVEVAEHGCDLDGLRGAGLDGRTLAALEAALAFDRARRVATAAAVLDLL